MQVVSAAPIDIAESVLKHFKDRGISPLRVSAKAFPEETVVIVEVDDASSEAAINQASSIEAFLPPNHIIVVRRTADSGDDEKSSIKSLADPKISRLIELLNERSRTSEQLPSLHYINDAAENIRVAVSRRHHVVFGRRGAGKTALLLEAKRQIEASGGLVSWINVQTLRGLSGAAAFLTVARRIAEIPMYESHGRRAVAASAASAQRLTAWMQKLLLVSNLEASMVAPIVPDVQRLISMICAEKGADLFVFLDDVHYLSPKEQPVFLDLVHGITRDAPAWIKIAGIRNQCRLFESTPPTGLQQGHDVAVVPLDVTLEDPQKAKEFLVGVLQTYLHAAGIGNRSGVLSAQAVDRLILASAGVPRDFLLLCARAIQLARGRERARTVGTQDVGEAVAEAGKQKLSDIEDDAASALGTAKIRLDALAIIRDFTISENHISFFRIDYRDKAAHPEEYGLVQSLMDLRMVHLVKASLSEAHAAGERSEVYLIDLSQYSSFRFKLDLNVLELHGEVLALRKTGEQQPSIVGNTPRRLVQIFRTGPHLELQKFSHLIEELGKA